MAFNGKYDPKTLDDLVIDPDNKYILELIASQTLKKSLILDGTNGTGKSTITKILPELTHGENYQIEKVRGNKNFVIDQQRLDAWLNIYSFNKFQGHATYIVIDEIDKIERDVPLFWQWLEDWEPSITVIGTTNRLLAIDKAIRSRAKCLTLQPIKAVDMLPRAKAIMQAEELTIDDSYLLSELKVVESLGDIRKYMERLELVAIGLRTGRINPQGQTLTPKRSMMRRVK